MPVSISPATATSGESEREKVAGNGNEMSKCVHLWNLLFEFSFVSLPFSIFIFPFFSVNSSQYQYFLKISSSSSSISIESIVMLAVAIVGSVSDCGSFRFVSFHVKLLRAFLWKFSFYWQHFPEVGHNFNVIKNINVDTWISLCFSECECLLICIHIHFATVLKILHSTWFMKAVSWMIMAIH